MPPLQPRELYPVFRKDFGYLVKLGGKERGISTLMHGDFYRRFLSIHPIVSRVPSIFIQPVGPFAFSIQVQKY